MRGCKIGLLIVLIISAAVVTNAQSSLFNYSSPIISRLDSAKISGNKPPVIQQFSSTFPKHSPVKTLPSNYHLSTIGFFCKKELQLEKAIKMPLRFRLGSFDYCNRLEGKNQ